MRHLSSLYSALALIVITLVSVVSSLPAQAAQSKVNPTEIDAIVNRVLDMYGVPGVAIGLIQNGKVVYTKGYSFADVEKQQPVTEQTEFAIGTAIQSFTALDIAQLVDAGKLNLDTPVINYLPDLKLADPDLTKRLTVRLLISQSSGIDSADLRLNITLDSRKQVVDDLVNIPLIGAPGGDWQYSTHNFVLAGYLIEQVSGESWEHYTMEHVLQPLGLNATTLDMESLLKTPDHALPYQLDVLKTVAEMQYTPDQLKIAKVDAPAETLSSNILDMAQYALFQLGNGTFYGTRIVSQKLLDELHTHQIDVRGTDYGNKLIVESLTQDVGYGMGWYTETYQAHKLVSRPGEVAGYAASVTLAPDDQLGIVVLSNLQSIMPFTDSLRLSLMANLLGLKSDDIPQQVAQHHQLDLDTYKKNAAAARSFKLDSVALNKFVGSYTGFTGVFLVQLVNGRLHLILAARNSELIPYAENSFLVNGIPGVTISFQVDSTGKTTLNLDSKPMGRLSSMKTAPYKDPNGRFSVLVPDGLTAEQHGDFVVFYSANPPGTFFFAAIDSVTADTKDDVEQWLAKNAQVTGEQTFNSLVELRDRLTWSTTLYLSGKTQELMLTEVKEGNTIYLICLQTDAGGIGALIPAIEELQLSFQVMPAQR